MSMEEEPTQTIVIDEDTMQSNDLIISQQNALTQIVEESEKSLN